MRLTGIVLTKNEERDIANCLSSLADVCDTLLVVDSGSSDDTVNVARLQGAIVKYREFDTYSSQRNYAIEVSKEYGDWALFLDADERLDSNLKNDILRVKKSDNGNVSAFAIRRKEIVFGKWIKFASEYPIWFTRMFKVSDLEVQRSINEIYVLKEGFLSRLNGNIIHYPLSKGEQFWRERHRKYSSMEADRLMCEKLSIKDFKESKRHFLKIVINKIPFKITLLWLYYFLFRLAFLDGREGIYWIKLKLSYERMIKSELKERKLKR